MSKDEASWLIVRTLGLALLIWTAYQLYIFALNLFFIAVYVPPPHMVAEGTIRLPDLDWRPLVRGCFSGGIAIYLLRFGRLPYLLLMKDGGEHDTNE